MQSITNEMETVDLRTVETTNKEEETVGQTSKRKRIETRPNERKHQDKGERPTKIIGDALGRVVKEAAELQALIQVNTDNTNDIKRKSNQLGFSIRQLQDKYVEAVKEEMCRSNKKENIWPKHMCKETKEIGTQVDLECYAQTASQTTQEDIENTCTYGKFCEIENRNWDQSLYRSTRIVEENPLNTNKEWNLGVWIEEEDQQMEKGIQKLYRDRYPELLDVDETPGHIMVTTHMKSKDLGYVQYHRFVHKLKDDASLESRFASLKSLRILMTSEGRTKIAFPAPSKADVAQLQKMTECIFAQSNIQVAIHIPYRRPTRPPLSRATSTVERRNTIRKTEAVIISLGKNTYADLLKKVKNIMKEEQLDKGVEAIRQTREGNLLISVPQQGKILKGKLQEKMQMLNISYKAPTTNQTTLHITGLDGTITKVEETLRSTLGTKQGEFISVNKLRPSRGYNQAVTIKVDKESAKKLLEIPKLRMGITPCVIRERIEILKCFKCWETGHESKGCKGPDRGRCCRKCGKEGHLVVECKEQPYCPLCGRFQR